LRLDGFALALADRADDLRAVEQTPPLLGRQPVLDVLVLHDLGERAAALVLPDHVGRHALLRRGTLEEERERISEPAQESGDCILRPMKRRSSDGRFAERVLRGVDDAGREERVVVWIERKPGALWAVGRAVNPQQRPSDEPRADDYVFEGYELDDALERANETLEDDVSVLERDGGDLHEVRPFTRKEVLPLLERWFFGR
jgi:hypothetical protein